MSRELFLNVANINLVDWVRDDSFKAHYFVGRFLDYSVIFNE